MPDSKGKSDNTRRVRSKHSLAANAAPPSSPASRKDDSSFCSVAKKKEVEQLCSELIALFRASRCCQAFDANAGATGILTQRIVEEHLSIVAKKRLSGSKANSIDAYVKLHQVRKTLRSPAEIESFMSARPEVALDLFHRSRSFFVHSSFRFDASPPLPSATTK
jgi:hypothetical protein